MGVQCWPSRSEVGVGRPVSVSMTVAYLIFILSTSDLKATWRGPCFPRSLGPSSVPKASASCTHCLVALRSHFTPCLSLHICKWGTKMTFPFPWGVARLGCLQRVKSFVQRILLSSSGLCALLHSWKDPRPRHLEAHAHACDQVSGCLHRRVGYSRDIPGSGE